MRAVKKTIEERLTERDLFANDVKSCCEDLADTFCGDNSCVTCITDKLMNLGYRKASDVAREIFAEIDKALDNSVETERFKGSWFNLHKFMQRLAELKKKYIGKDTNVTTKESESEDD